MAVYHGFFDAAIDELTGEYDRVYGAEDFTQYFERIVGTGVCVYENPDSLKAYYDSSSQRVLVNPGYAFIRGYWMKNDALFGIDMQDAATGEYVILAKLSLSRRLCEIVLESKSPEESYIDELVLAYVTVGEDSAVTVTDNRGETYCPTIDALGSISEKVKWAISYIETELDARLDEILSSLEEKSAEIDSKVEEANSLIAKIEPPAVGTIKFSASQDVGEEWLRCDGSFINEVDYPELVAALGKLIPSGDKFSLLNTTNTGNQPTNAIAHSGRLWFYSYTNRKLYGLDLEGETEPKAIQFSGDADMSAFQNPLASPIGLSIIPDLTNSGKYRIFLAQINAYTEAELRQENWSPKNPVYTGEFNPSSDTITLSAALETVAFDAECNFVNDALGPCLPYVVSKLNGGLEEFSMAVCAPRGADVFVSSSGEGSGTLWAAWTETSAQVHQIKMFEAVGKNLEPTVYLSTNFNKKNNGELVVPYNYAGTEFGVASVTAGIFDRSTASGKASYFEGVSTSVIGGAKKVLFQVAHSLDKLLCTSLQDIEPFVEVPINVALPPAAKAFLDAGAYLWGKDIFLIFVGTGFLFSRTLEEGSFGYLDTTSVLGVISQYASIDYAENEGALYVVGQDTTNSIKAAKIKLNTLFDYSSDGAWLPLIASDGVPAYIKALGEPPAPEPVIIPDFQVTSSQTSGLPSLTSVFSVTLDGVAPATQINFEVPSGQVPVIMTALQDYTNQTESGLEFSISVAGYGSDGFPKYSEVVIVGKVLQKGEKITAGESVTGYYDFSTVATYPDVVSVRITYTTKAAQ